MTTINGTKHLSLAEFAARVGISVTTARKHIKEGRVACVQLGRHTSPLLIPENAVDEFLKRSYRPAAAA